MVIIKRIKMQENDKNYKKCKKIGKNIIVSKKTLERSSDKPGNYSRCVLWKRYRLGLDFWISILMKETYLGCVFIGIGSPSALGVRRDNRESVKIVV